MLMIAMINTRPKKIKPNAKPNAKIAELLPGIPFARRFVTILPATAIDKTK